MVNQIGILSFYLMLLKTEDQYKNLMIGAKINPQH